MKHSLFILVLAMSLGACSKGSGSKTDKKVTITEEQMSAVISYQTLSCPSRDCPDAIARLFIINFGDAENSSMCTGSLVGDRLLLTNSHCIDKQTTEKACAGFYAIFNTKRGGYEVARCSKVLFRHSNAAARSRALSDRDYALIELDRSVRATPLEIEPNGFAIGDTIHPYVVDHTSLYNARIVKLNCTVKEDNPEGRDTMFENCPAIGGNSGSPVLNTAGKVAGVLYAAQDTVVTEETPYEERIAAPNFSLGFSMDRILEDLQEWF